MPIRQEANQQREERRFLFKFFESVIFRESRKEETVFNTNAEHMVLSETTIETIYKFY